MKNGIVADEDHLKASRSSEMVCSRTALAKSNPLYVCAYYRPPNDNAESLDSLQGALEELAELPKNNSRSTVVLAGEFNCCDIDWETQIPTVDSKKKWLCNKLINIVGDSTSCNGSTFAMTLSWTCAILTNRLSLR